MTQQMDIERLQFDQIDTIALLRGQKIQSSYSFRTPVGIDEVRRIDAALVRAYGNDTARTEARIWPYNPYNVLLRRQG